MPGVCRSRSFWGRIAKATAPHSPLIPSSSARPFHEHSPGYPCVPYCGVDWLFVHFASCQSCPSSCATFLFACAPSSAWLRLSTHGQEFDEQIKTNVRRSCTLSVAQLMLNRREKCLLPYSKDPHARLALVVGRYTIEIWRTN